MEYLSKMALSAAFLILVPTISASEVQTTKWQVGELKEDILTKEKSVYISLMADKIEGDVSTVEMLIRCQKRTELYIVWDKYLGIDDHEVEFRIDDNPVQRTKWG